MPFERFAHRARDLVAQDQRVAHRLAPQVERAVAQAERLVHAGVLVEREGRRRRGREHVELLHGELDLTCRQ